MNVDVDRCGSMAMIGVQENLIHKGMCYYISCNNGSLSYGSVYFYAVKTPLTASVDGYMHLKYQVCTLGSAVYEVYESGSMSSTGSVFYAYNANRAIDGRDLSSSWYKNVSVSAGASGTQLDIVYLGTQTVSKGTPSQGVYVPMLIEWILKPSTTYLFKISSTSEGTRVIVSFM